MKNIVDPDQLASKKPADLDLHCFQNWIISGFRMDKVKIASLCLLEMNTYKAESFII